MRIFEENGVDLSGGQWQKIAIARSFYGGSDFLILDCWLPPKAKPYIKGAEHCKAWAVREWLLKLAIPEHALVWTFLVCPLAGFAVAGLGTLLG